MNFLFPKAARITRASFWKRTIALTVGIWLVGIAAAVNEPNPTSPAGLAGYLSFGVLAAAAVGLIFAVGLLVVQIKRWHDLNRSGWMICINFIPGIGSLVTLICLGFMKGTDGPNNFGEQP